MVNPGMNQDARSPQAFNNERMRRAPMGPNSPRDSAVGVVIPRAMKPDCVSKSNVRQTMWRGNAVLLMATGDDEAADDRNHRQRRDRADRLDATSRQRARPDHQRRRP